MQPLWPSPWILEAVDFTAALALEAVFFADVVAVFFAVDFALCFATAAASFAALGAFIPAFSSPAFPALAILAAVVNPAACNFFAVAAPTPGSAVNSSSLDAFFFAAIV